MNDEEDEMPAKRELTMRQIRELLRLSHEGCSVRDMACRYGVARSTIQDNLKRAKNAGFAWPLPADLTDEVLEQQLFAHNGTKPGFRRLPEPDWALLAREMKRPGVNLSVLWEEYRQVHPEGYGYSRYVAARLMWR
jgi:transposase